MQEGRLLKKLEDFVRSDWSLVVENRTGLVFRSKEEKLRPLLKCIEQHSSEMKGAILFDRVVGRAAALLCAYARVGTVLTPLLSDGGREALNQFAIPFHALGRVKEILNEDSSGPCPMEEKARGKSPLEFHELITGSAGQSC